MEHTFFTTNDGVQIAYTVSGEGRPIFLLPGWGCTSRFWDHNVPVLAEQFQVITMDMRGHGESQKVTHGHRIARYAMDVRNLFEHLDVQDVTVVGWSMGASILWSYLELFGKDRVTRLVCVDQSPAQYHIGDWRWGQTGCYDVEKFVELCCGVRADPDGAARGLVFGCLEGTPTDAEVELLGSEIAKCPAEVRIEIMRDHTNLDWRDLLPHLSLPTLVCVARKSKVFPWQGSAWVGEAIPGARTEFFEESGHMLFWQEPEKFNRVLADFVNEV